MGCYFWSSTIDVDESTFTPAEYNIVKMLQKTYGYSYDYTKIKVHNNYNKVTIICPQLHEFLVSQPSVISRRVCPKCLHEIKMKNVMKYYNIADNYISK
jgi:hypothetical protein